MRLFRGFRWIVIIAALLAMIPAAASAETAADLERRLQEAQEERERAQRDLRETREQETDARTRLAAIENELSREEAALAALQRDLEAAREALIEAERRAAQARSQLEEVHRALEIVEGEFAAKRARLETRIRAAFKYGHVSFTEAFAGVRDITDFLNTTHYVSHVLGADRDLVESLTESIEAIAAQQAVAASLKADAEREEAEAADITRQIELATAGQREMAQSIRMRRTERARALEELRDDRASLEGHLAGLEAESARIQEQLAEIARRQAEEAHRKAYEAWQEAVAEWEACQAANAQAEEDADAANEAGADPAVEPDLQDCGEQPPSSPPPPSSISAGSWVRPVSGRLSSPFGPRWGRMHYGVDLANSMGTAIRAAQSGTVVWTVTGCNAASSWGCGGGFGNYVVVDHGGGFATVYAHLANVGVQSGGSVGAGQTIGTVGNSGNSYGPHLHFEFYDGGVRRNPCNYISC
ncbi:MAG: peptidoglycan DD-metalloendopeptidase family protein [Nitriliruptoraceae bacterium]